MRKPCLGCGRVGNWSRCPACQPKRLSPSQRGHGREFYRLKPVILERDGYECQLRRVGCTHYATTVDYVVPWSQGGQLDESNLVAACLRCNSGKGGR